MPKGCDGRVRDPDQGYRRDCPIRGTCWKYHDHIASYRPYGYHEILAPYDFDDDDCGEFELLPPEQLSRITS